MRRLALAAASLATFSAVAAAALAADQEVAARNSSFAPQQTALTPGDTLTIRHDDGALAHDLQFEDEATARVKPGTGWTVQRTFTAAEAREQPYTFFCNVHPGMSGRVFVNATGTVPTPSPTATPSRTPTATPTATRTPAPTPTAAPSQPGAPAGAPGTAPPGATLRSASVPAVACMRRSARCRRPGVRLRLALAAAADVRATLRRRAPRARRFKAFGTVRFGRVAAGERTLRFTRTAAGRRLAAGRYRMTLSAAGERRTLAFRVL